MSLPYFGILSKRTVDVDTPQVRIRPDSPYRYSICTVHSNLPFLVPSVNTRQQTLGALLNCMRAIIWPSATCLSRVVSGVALFVLFLVISLPSLLFPVLGADVYRYELNPLVTNSPLIVVATVDQVVGSYSSSQIGVSGVIFKLAVSEWIRGGGYPYPFQVVDGNSTVEGSVGSPSIRVGSTYVLFLFNTGVSVDGINAGGLCLTYPQVVRCHDFPPPTNETWGITGGPQGKFLVQDGLVYGFKALYPQLYGSMTVDADGVPLDEFVSMIRSRVWFVSLPTEWSLLAIPFLLLGLLGRTRRVKAWRFTRRLKPAGLVASYGLVLAATVYLLETGSLSFLATLNFWLGFLAFGTLFLVFIGVVVRQRDKYKRRIGSAIFELLTCFLCFVPLVVILIVLFQAGYTMFEKDFFRLALIAGVLAGSAIGAVLGDAIPRLKALHAQKTTLSQSPPQVRELEPGRLG